MRKRETFLLESGKAPTGAMGMLSHWYGHVS